MRDYEIVYIFRASLSAEEVESRLQKYHGILSSAGGEVTALEHWGKRQLAYPIQKETNGYYVVAQFTAEADVLPELERALKLDEELLRHLIVLSEGEPPLPMPEEESAPPGRRRREEEDDEDEDEDEDEDLEEDEDVEDEVEEED